MTLRVIFVVIVNESLASRNNSTIYNCRSAFGFCLWRNYSTRSRLATYFKFFFVFRCVFGFKRILAFPKIYAVWTYKTAFLYEAFILIRAQDWILFENI